MGIETVEEFIKRGIFITCKEVESEEAALVALRSGTDICVIRCPNSAEVCCAQNWIAGKLSNRATWPKIPSLEGYVRLWSAKPASRVVSMLKRHFGSKLVIVV